MLAPTFGGFGDNWAFPRPYIYGFAQNWPANCAVSIVANSWTLTLPTGFGVGVGKQITFKNRFYLWTSNKWTLRFAFEDFYVFSPTAHTAPEAVTVHYRRHPTTGKLYLALDVGFWTDWYYYQLPPSPTGYWATLP